MHFNYLVTCHVALQRKREPEYCLEKKILELDDAKRAFAEINRYAAVDNTELEEDMKVCSLFPFLRNHLSHFTALGIMIFVI